MSWLIPLRFARVLLPEGDECVAQTEEDVWLMFSLL